MKKIRNITLFTLLLSSLAIGVACSKKDDKLQKENYVSLNVENYAMTVGDELLLSMDYDLDKNASFSYSSSNTNVATVDENGNVTAENNGVATITVTYGNASDSCVITVDKGNQLAYLQYRQIPTDEFCVSINQEFKLSPYVIFNGKIYEDMAVEYSVDDSTVGIMENGVFKATGVGKTQITATASWRGEAYESLTKTLSVEVVHDVQIYFNQGADSAFALYTVKDDGTALKSGATSLSVTAGAMENGVEIPAERLNVELASGEQYVSFDGKTIASKGVAGEAALKISFTDSFGTEWEKTFPITITPTLFPYEKTLTGFSAMDGDFIGGNSLFKVLGGRVLNAEDSEGNPLTVENGKIYGVKTSGNGVTKTTIAAYSKKCGYLLNIEGYTGIIDEAEDLKIFGLKQDDYQTHPDYGKVSDTADRGYTFLAQRQEGYYILANNIDASGYTQPAGGKNITTSIYQITKFVAPIGGIGLTGTFDGNGYTIRGLTTQTHGLFGIIYEGTVKNVAFTQMKLAGSYASSLAQWIINGNLENVYIQADSMTGKNTSLISGCLSGTSVRGCIFEIPQEKGESDLYGSLSYMTGRERTSSGFYANVFNGAFVVSPMLLTYYKNTSKKVEYITDGENRTGANYTYMGLYRYDTQADFEAAENSFVTFDSTCWDKSGKTPKWKTVDFVIVERPEEETEIPENGENFSPDWL